MTWVHRLSPLQERVLALEQWIDEVNAECLNQPADRLKSESWWQQPVDMNPSPVTAEMIRKYTDIIYRQLAVEWNVDLGMDVSHYQGLMEWKKIPWTRLDSKDEIIKITDA